MSQPTAITVTCCHCHHEGGYTIWNRINTMENPELVDRVLLDSLFNYQCPHCKAESSLPYGFVYHDLKHKCVILFEPDIHQDEKGWNRVLLPAAEGIEGFDLRRVIGYHALREKVFLLENGLSDVAVERMKYTMKCLTTTTFVEEDQHLYCVALRSPNISDLKNEMLFWVIDRTGCKVDQFSCPLEPYYDYKLACSIDPRMKTEGFCCVDEAWMKEQMQKL